MQKNGPVQRVLLPWAARSFLMLPPYVAREDSKHHHGARDAANFGITLSANRRRLSREP